MYNSTKISERRLFVRRCRSKPARHRVGSLLLFCVRVAMVTERAPDAATDCEGRQRALAYTAAREATLVRRQKGSNVVGYLPLIGDLARLQSRFTI